MKQAAIAGFVMQATRSIENKDFANIPRQDTNISESSNDKLSNKKNKSEESSNDEMDEYFSDNNNKNPPSRFERLLLRVTDRPTGPGPRSCRRRTTRSARRRRRRATSRRTSTRSAASSTRTRRCSR